MIEPATNLLPSWIKGAKSDDRSHLPPAEPLPPLDMKDTAGITDRYIAFCKSLQLTAHPAVLIFLRLRFSELRPVAKEMPVTCIAWC